MNIINQLFDEQYIRKLFKKEVLPKYPDFLDIKKVLLSLRGLAGYVLLILYQIF